MSIKTGSGSVVTTTRVSSSFVRPPGFQFPVGLGFLGTDTSNVVTSFIGTGTWVAPPSVTSVDYLVVGGGGGSNGGQGGLGDAAGSGGGATPGS